MSEDSSIKVMSYATSVNDYDSNKYKENGCGAAGVIGSLLFTVDDDKNSKSLLSNISILGLTRCSNMSNISSNTFAGGLVAYTEYRESKILSNYC